MLKSIIKVEDEISADLGNADIILGKQNIKKLIDDMLIDCKWEQIKNFSRDERQIYYKFFGFENNMEIYNNIAAICKNNFNVSDLVSEIGLLNADQNISLNQERIKKYICFACVCGFLKIKAIQHIEIKNVQRFKCSSELVETVYLIENILCGVYGDDGSILSDRDITIGINSDKNDFWMDYMLYNIARIEKDFKVVEDFRNCLNEQKSEGDNAKKAIEAIKEAEDHAKKEIEGTLDEKFKNYVNNFYGRTMEIIGIFIAIFSLIGFNLFSANNMNLINILILNLSCILGIAVMFFLIKHILDDKVTDCKFIAIIITLVVAILILS